MDRTYTGFDYDTLLDDLKSRIQQRFGADYNDFTAASLGQMLLDILAYAGDSLAFYTDQRAREMYLSTARVRSSVARIALMLGYSMGGAICATTDLQVALKKAQTFQVVLPVGFQFQGPNSTIFSVGRQVSWGIGNTDAQTVSVYQGQTITETFTSDGTAGQKFSLSGIPDGALLASGSVVVMINGVTWEEVPLLDLGANAQYQVQYAADPPEVIFGSGVIGAIPPSGVGISVSYVATQGTLGATAAGNITSVISPLVVNFSTVDLVVTQPVATTPGADLESIESAQVNAPKVRKTRGAAVTSEDYVSLASAYASPLYGRVAVAHAQSLRSATSDLKLNTDLAALLALSSGLVSPVTASVNSVSAYLNAALTAVAAAMVDATESVAVTNVQVGTTLPGVVTTLGQAKSQTVQALSDAAMLSDVVTSFTTALSTSAIPAGSEDALTATTRAALTTLVAQVEQIRQSVVADATQVRSYVDTSSSAVSTAVSALTSLGTTTSSGYLGDIITQQNAVIADIGSSSSGAFSGLVAILSEVIDTTAKASTYTQSIFDHVDGILAGDSKANVVEVPILAKDSEGFYIAPPSGLIQSLQTYLEGCADQTHTVVVSSGAGALVPVVLTIEAGIKTGEVAEAIVRSQILAVVYGLLKGRSFGTALYQTTVHSALSAIDGVAYVNVVIQGYTDPITGLLNTTDNDASGNLVPSAHQVLTRGTVTITTVAVSG